jgi:hypothetical protein
MGFLDLFRPKWKNSDADVRAEAVKELSAEDAALLAQVVRQDADVRVRRIALKKIDDPQLLGELAESDPDETLRKDAAEKASNLLLSAALADGDESRSLTALERLAQPKAIAEAAKRASYESVRRAALTRLSDAKAIADVARKSDDPHVRRQAVERVSEQTTLREIAISDGVKEVALAAVERLEDVQALENVVKKTKSKAVKGAAKAKLQSIKDAQRPKDGGLSSEKRKARLALICRTVDEAAASDDWHHAASAIEVSRQALGELGVQKGEEVFQKRFDRAVLKFQARREESLAKERARAAFEAKRAAAQEEAQKREAAEEELNAQKSAEDAKLKEIADAARKVEDERKAAERARRAEEKAKRDAEKAQRDAEKAAERAKKDAEAEDNLRRLEEVSARLESLAENEDRKLVEGALKSADDVVRSGGNLPKEKAGAARDRYAAARQKLVIRMQEMRDTEDWKRWSNVPRLEALCGKMEALLTAPEGSDLKQMQADLKALQAEWKTVGPAPKEKSEALWKRFKDTADQVYARCKPKPTVSDEERAANLAKKEALCVRVAELAAAPDETINWKDTAESVKALQEEWKGVGPVATKEQADALWKRFRESCDQFFDRRKAHFAVVDEERGGNLKKLEALCVRAEELAGVPDDTINWKDTAEQVKQLQADWKETGPAPRAEGEVVWKRFREACDKFFDRRKAHFDKQDAERAGNLKQKELLCEKVEALAALPASEHEAALQTVKQLQAEWKTIGPAPKEQSDAVWNRFREACDKVYDAGRTKEPEPLAPLVPAVDPKDWPKFENKLPLAGIAEKLAAATSEWEDIATDNNIPIVKKEEDKKPG